MRHWPFILTLCLLLLAGCASHDRPTHAAFSHNSRELSLLDRGERLLETADHALDNLGARLDNSID